MNKFAVFSGFLGAGKTTAMMALTAYYTGRHGRAAMISNDLGHGVTLADDRQAKLAGCRCAQITDECICFVRDELAARLTAFYADGCDLVLSDIPGFGVGALEHVYHGLTADYPGRFSLAPFTVLTEPRSVDILRRSLPDDMAPILRAQLMEADLIVLNKCDLLPDAERQTQLSWLREHFPQAQVLGLSARTGEGLEALSLALKNGAASLRHPEIDYEDAALIRAMDSLSEYYLQGHLTVCCNDFDGTAFLTALAERLRDGFAAGGFPTVPHFKLLAWTPEGDYGKTDLLGVDRPVELTRRFARPCTQLALILNASAACPAAPLKTLVREAVSAVSAKYQLEFMLFKEECFNLGE